MNKKTYAGNLVFQIHIIPFFRIFRRENSIISCGLSKFGPKTCPNLRNLSHNLSVRECIQARAARIFVYRHIFEAVLAMGAAVTGGLVPGVARGQGPVLGLVQRVFEQHFLGE